MNMRSLYLFPLLLLFFCVNVMAQTDREFWFVAPEVTVKHDPGRVYDFGGPYDGGEPVFLRFTTLDKPSDIIITMPAQAGFDTIRLSMPAKSVRSLNMTDLKGNDMIENKFGTNGKNTKGIHIESSEVITAYYEVYTQNNTDLFSLKGKNGLGTIFFTPFQNISPNHYWDQPDRAYHAAHIVATKNGTVVEITPTQWVEAGVTDKPPGIPYTVTLNAGETYSICPKDFSVSETKRLSGTKITSNYPIAVTTSDDSGQFIDGGGCYDLMGDQLIPVQRYDNTPLIGTEYIAIRGQIAMQNRAAGKTGEQLYILATEDATGVSINGVPYQTINAQAQAWYEFSTTDNVVHIQASKPVYVFHVSGFGCEMGGAVLPPTNKCTGSWQVGFTRSTKDGFFLNLMVRKEGYADFKLNGVSVLTDRAGWMDVPGDPDWLARRVNYSSDFASVPVQQQSIMENKVGIFHLGAINGNETGGCRYGYFSDFNELKISAITINTASPNIRICHGETVKLEAYGGSNFKWKPSLFLDQDNVQRPVCNPKASIKYTVVTQGLCGIKDSAYVTVEVLPRVEALFTIDTSQACAPYNLKIFNHVSGASEVRWRFGDGSPELNSNDSIINHLYRNQTDTAVLRDIRLTVANQESCRDTLTRSILIYPEIAAGFTADKTVGCHPLVTKFTNTSTGANDTLPSYIWDFGDGGASSVTKNPSHTFNNITSNSKTYNVRLVSRNLYGCSDTAFKPIQVHPYIQANFEFSPDVSCNPYKMQISNSSVGASSYKWSFGDGTPNSTSSAATLTHDYNNTTTATKVYNIELNVANTNGCKDTLKRKVTVHPTLKAVMSPSATEGCDSLVVTFANTSIGASEHKWEFGDGSSSIEKSPSHVYRNLTDQDITFTVRYIARASNLFCAETLTTNILVHPYIKSSFNYSPSDVCSPYTVNITNTSIGVDTYSWTFGDGQTSTSNAASLTHLYENNTSLDQSFDLTLTGTNTEGCKSVLTRKVKVYPGITADYTHKATSCDSGFVKFSNTSTGAATYIWDFGDGSSSSEASPNHLYRNLGTTNVTYTVKLTAVSANLLCRSTKTTTVTVYPFVKAGFSFDPTAGCSPFDIQITNYAKGAASFNWDFGNGNSTTSNASFSRSFVNPTSTTKSFTINQEVTNAAGCVSTMSKELKVYPEVIANFSINSGCEPHIISNFKNTTTNAAVYEWDFGDGSSSNKQSPSHTFRNLSNTTDVSYKVTLRATSANNCVDIKDTTIRVFAKPFANYSLGAPSGCSPYEFDVNHTSVGQTAATWDFGDGRPTQNWNIPNFTVSYTNNSAEIKNYTVSLLVTNDNNCSDTLARSIAVYPAVTSAFELSSGCSPHIINATTFNNTSVGVKEYKWEFGDGTQSTLQHPTHTFNNFDPTKDVSYTVKLTTTSFTGCTASSSKTMTVYAKPSANFSVGDANGCSPYSVDFTNASSGATDYTWDFGDGNPTSNRTDKTFTYLYYNSSGAIKNNSISLIAANASGCSDTAYNSVVIYPDITAQFSLTSGCNPLVISNFNNTSAGALEYSWNFGDGSSSTIANPTHEFNNLSHTRDTTFNVRLTTKRYECQATKDTVITVFHKPLADFEISNPGGCSPHTSSFINLAKGFDTLVWDFGDGSAYSYAIVPSLTHGYTNRSGVDKVIPATLRAITSKGCSDTMVRNTVVHSEVIANFRAFSGCSPHTIPSFNNTSTGATMFSWTYGDGTSGNKKDTAHTYSNSSNTVNASYKISLQASSIYGCKDIHDTTITVYPLPYADFNINNSDICTPDSTIFRNSAVGVNNAADSLFWDFGDGSPTENSKATLLYHTYKNHTSNTLTFNTTLTAKNRYGCVDTAVRSARVKPDVTAEFVVRDGCHPHTISNFFNTSFNAQFSDWSFGDGTSSNQKNPTKKFTNTSNTADSMYTVRLTTRSKEGCTASKDTVITIHPLPLADFLITNSSGCSPFTAVMTNNAVGADTIIWKFGDGSPIERSLAAQVSHAFNNNTGATKTYITTQTAITRHGCTASKSRNTVVHSNITAAFWVADGCHPLTINDFHNTSFDADKWTWTFGDATSSNEQHPKHTFVNTSNTVDKKYTVKLVTESVEGCKASKDTILTVHPMPAADFLINNPVGCSPFTVLFANNAVGADTLLWSFGDGSAEEQNMNASLSHLYRNHTGNTITFTTIQTAKTRFGCVDTAIRKSNIYSDISSEFWVKDGCHPLVVNDFHNTSFDADSWEWSFGDGTSSNLRNPKKIFNNTSKVMDSSFTVSLTTRSVEGCQAQYDTVITVHPVPNADFLINNPVGCSPYAVEFSNNASGADTLLWDFGDGGPVERNMSPVLTHLYKNATGSTRIFTTVQTAITKFGCTDTAVRKSNIHSDITARFWIKDGCHPLQVDSFHNTSFDADSWEWNFGDNVTSNLEHPSHLFTNISNEVDSVYTVTLRIASKEGCSDEVDTTITIHPVPRADFNIMNPVGCSPYAVKFDNDAIGAAILLWDFGDGSDVVSSTDDYLTHTYRNHTGNTQVLTTIQTAKTIHGCLDTAMRRSTIHSDITAAFEIESGCQPWNVTNFRNTSFDADQWAWSFGDGVTSNEEFPTHLFTNLSYIRDTTYLVSLVTKSVEKCSAYYDTVITIYHKPLVDFSVDNTPGCSPYPVNFTNKTLGASIITWNYGDGSPLDTVIAKKNTHTYRNPGPQLVNYPVTLTAFSNKGCSDTLTMEATVYPDIQAGFSIRWGCQPVIITDFNNTSTGASSWRWNFGDGETSNLEKPVHSFHNFSNTTDSVYKVSLDVESAYGCKARRDTLLTVYHNPLANFTVLNSPQCAPATINFKNTSKGMDSCLWSFGDLSYLDTTNVANISHLYQNMTDNVVEYRVKLKTATPQGCVDSTSHTATLYPFIDAQFAAIEKGCSPLNISFYNYSTGAFKNEWTFGDGNASNDYEPKHTYFNYSNTEDSIQTVLLRTTSKWGCSDTITQRITVFANPEAQFVIENSPICSPGILEITNHARGADSVMWSYGDGTTSSDGGIKNITHPYINADTIFKKVTLRMITMNKNLCYDTTYHDAFVYPNISSVFTADSVGCAPLISKFTNNSIGAFENRWDFGDGNHSSFREPLHTFHNYSNLVDSLHVVTLVTVSKWGCSDTSSINFRVYANPKANFAINNSPICSPDSIRITNLSVGADSLFWNFDDGLTEGKRSYHSFAHFYRNHDTAVHTHSIKLWVNNESGCRDSVSYKATVYPDITSVFTTDSVGCQPLVSQFENMSFGAHAYDWDFGDGTKSNLKEPKHEFVNYSYTDDSVQTVSLATTSKWGCKAFSSKQFIIFPEPKSQFTVLNPTICSPDSIRITNASIGASTYYWTFGDSLPETRSRNNDFAHYYRNPDSVVHKRTIQLITSTGRNCRDTLSRDVFIYPDIESLFEVNNQGCTPHTARFVNKSKGSYLNNWSFGNGTVSSQRNPVHTYLNNSHYTDSLHTARLITVSQWGCSDTSSILMTIYPNPLSQFAIDNSPICSPDTIHLTNLSQGADSLFWDFADNQTLAALGGKKFSHAYNNPGELFETRNIQLRAFTSHGCSDTIMHSAIVYPDISSEFTANLEGCSPLLVKTANKSKGANTYFWNWNDGNTTNFMEPEHWYFNRTYNSTLKFNLSLRTISQYGCEAYSDTTISVYPNPVAEFAVQNSTACSPFPVNISNISQGASKFSWDFGDGQSNTDGRPQFAHTYTNTTGVTAQHKITLVASTNKSCTDTIVHTITVYPEVIAEFAGNFTGCEPLKVVFSNQSLYGQTHDWYFGDGDTTSIKTPTHFYVNNNNIDTQYVARLISTSAYNCVDTAEHLVTVYPQPDADFDANPKFQVFPRSDVGKATVDVTDLTSPGKWEYTWDMGDQTTLNTTGSFAHDYTSWNKNGKHYTIKLRVENEQGCFDTVSQRIVITSPRPEPNVVVNDTAGCPPLNIAFDNNTAYATKYYWDFGDGFKSIDEDPSHVYNYPGTYNVTMIVEGDGGRDSSVVAVTVYRVPEAKFRLSGSFLNMTDSLRTVNLSSYASAYEWDFGDGELSTDKNPSHKYRQEGVYSVKLTAISQEGCKDDTTSINGVNVQAPCGIEFPNAFTPNPSGPSQNGAYIGLESTNDIFFPAKLEKGIDTYHLEVYNKWGEMVFATDDKLSGWDGYYRDKLSKMDVYVWKCKATCVDGSKINLIGDVSLIR